MLGSMATCECEPVASYFQTVLWSAETGLKGDTWYVVKEYFDFDPVTWTASLSWKSLGHD